MKKLTLLITLCLLFSFNAYGATPTISSYEDGVITCANAGTKSPASPVLWSQFDNGVADGLLSADANWPKYSGGNEGALYSSDNAYSGTMSAYNYVESNDLTQSVGRSGFDTNYHTIETPADTLYVFHKYKYIQVGSSGEGAYGIGKQTRLNSSIAAGGGGIYNGSGDSGWTNINFFYGGSGYVCFNNGSIVETIGWSTAQQNTWSTLEMLTELSTAGIDDGLVMYDNVGINKVLSDSCINRATGEIFKKDTVILGLMFANISTLPSSKVEMWIDDVYIDITRARVMIGDNAVYANCTNREIQIPTAWATDEVTVTENDGAFTAGDTAYLFVINSDGEVSDGFEFVLGGITTITTSLTGNATITGNVSFD